MLFFNRDTYDFTRISEKKRGSMSLLLLLLYRKMTFYNHTSFCKCAIQDPHKLVTDPEVVSI